MKQSDVKQNKKTSRPWIFLSGLKDESLIMNVF